MYETMGAWVNIWLKSITRMAGSPLVGFLVVALVLAVARPVIVVAPKVWTAVVHRDQSVTVVYRYSVPTPDGPEFIAQRGHCSASIILTYDMRAVYQLPKSQPESYTFEGKLSELSALGLVDPCAIPHQTVHQANDLPFIDD